MESPIHTLTTLLDQWYRTTPSTVRQFHLTMYREGATPETLFVMELAMAMGVPGTEMFQTPEDIDPEGYGKWLERVAEALDNNEINDDDRFQAARDVRDRKDVVYIGWGENWGRPPLIATPEHPDVFMEEFLRRAEHRGMGQFANEAVAQAMLAFNVEGFFTYLLSLPLPQRVLTLRALRIADRETQLLVKRDPRFREFSEAGIRFVL